MRVYVSSADTVCPAVGQLPAHLCNGGGYDRVKEQIHGSYPLGALLYDRSVREAVGLNEPVPQICAAVFIFYGLCPVKSLVAYLLHTVGNVDILQSNTVCKGCGAYDEQTFGKLHAAELTA